MQGRQLVGAGRIHPKLENRHSTLSRGTIEDIPMDQVDLAQSSNLYARHKIEEKHLLKQSQSHVMLQTRNSGLSERQVPFPVPRSRVPSSVWYDQEENRNKYIDNLKQYIREHFHQKECCMFVPAPNQKVKKVRGLKCHCGEVLMEHAGMRNVNHVPAKANMFALYLIPKELRPYISSHKFDEEPSSRMPELTWSKENIRSTVTNTYGKINFVNVEHHGGKKPAKYLRISDEDSVDKLMHLMMEHWKIMEPQAPHLVISVVGGAKNFKLDGRMRDTFATGLIKTAKTTSAWLITSGFNMGVMKAVGQAVRQGQSFCWDNERMAHVLRCIGIAPWGYVMDRKKLEREEGKESLNVDFRMSNAILHGQPVPLNADHTHFIFVDDGYRNRYGGVAAVRSKFEQKVCKNVKDGGLGIPVVLVVVEGGSDAISDAKSSLEHQIPVVICSGTGRAADIIAYAYSHTKAVSGGAREMTQKHLGKLREKIFDAYGKAWKETEKDNKTDNILDMVISCCEKSNLITVFNMNKQEDLDLAILSALLKATSGASEDQRLKQLKLALTWNRVDIAQEEIFREDVLWKPESLYGTVIEAILTDKMKFIELIMQQGSVIMKEFLTASRLQELYSKVPKYHFIYRLMYKLTREEDLTLGNIDKLLFQLLDRFGDEKDDKTTLVSDYDDSDEETIEMDPEKIVFKHPYKKLMIWAVLMHRQNFAKFCWEMGDEPVTSAIAMTRLYDAISKCITRNESELRDRIYMYKNEFEDLATCVLNECHERDPEKAMMIVERQSPTWNEMTCLQIAAASNDQMFIASEACLNSVDTIWKRGILSRWFKILLCVLCPLYVVFSMDFIGGKKSLTWYQKLGTFFTAPTTKFYYRMILYILFMCLHSYMVLVDFDANRITSLELLCTVWIVAFVIDKIHTVIAFPSLTLKSKFRDFVGFMDMIEFINYIMCLIGFISHVTGHPRVTKVFYCINAAFFIINLTKYYMASSVLGPKVNMITRMMKELAMFLIVVVVFLLAYGISSQGLLYKERSPDWVILKDIVYYPYWQLYGELFLEEIDTGECIAGSMNCRTFHWMVPILLGVYLLVGNILLLTLLIAIFSNVFDNVEQNAKTISKYYMYFLVVEHDVKVFLPPPFCIIQHLFLIFHWLFTHTCCKRDKEKQTLGKRHLEYLQLFEKENMTNMIRQRKEDELISLETTVTSLEKRVDDLTRLIEDEVIADAHTGQSTTPFTLSRYPSSMMDDNQQTTSRGQSWPRTQEVINVKDKVMNSAIPSDYFSRSIPALTEGLEAVYGGSSLKIRLPGIQRNDSAALLVLPSESGSRSVMTIPVTLTGEKSGDTTKIMVQELRSSRKGEFGTKQEDVRLTDIKEGENPKEGGVKEDQDSKDKILIMSDNAQSKQDIDIISAEEGAETPKLKRRTSSKKRKRDNEAKTDDLGEVNNVNRPHSSLGRGEQRVHFLLPGDETDTRRPNTAAQAIRKPAIAGPLELPERPTTAFGRYTNSLVRKEQGQIDITDLNAVYGQTNEYVPHTAWNDKQIETLVDELLFDDEQIESLTALRNAPEPVIEADTTSKDKKKKKKKKKKKGKHEQEEQESSA